MAGSGQSPAQRSRLLAFRRSGTNGSSTAGGASSACAASGRHSDRGVGNAVRITWLGHATVLVEIDGLRLLTDPLLGAGLGPLRRVGATPDPRAIGEIDAILVSHAHPDHFDLDSLRRVSGDPLVIVPGGIGRAARRAGRSVREVVAGEVFELSPRGAARSDTNPIRLTVVHARHWRWPLQPRARCLGYLVAGSPWIYVT